MCLAIPVRISRVLDEHRAVAEIGGVEREINVTLLEDIREGDYVILHVGFALARLDEAEARRTLQLMAAGGLADTPP